jgi:8-oxo-dGTP pyrophosphatase MutT (NUDIX family)
MSIGVIAFRYHRDELQYIMIQRKDSLGFVEFMRGKYQQYNIEYVQNIFNEMTTIEKHKIVTYTFDELWKYLWGDWIGNQYRNEERISREKHRKFTEGLIIDNKSYNLQYFVDNSDANWINSEWGFPKGRRNYQEKDINCALREFEEETGYSKSDVKIATNVVPYEEIFTGSNLKSYKHKYNIGYIDTTIELTNNNQKSEVSEVAWLNVEDCINKIRPYNLEKISMLKKIDEVLRTYRLYS